MKTVLLYICCYCLCFNLREIKAQWSSDPTQNNLVAITDYYQEAPALCSDRDGGALVIWSEMRTNGWRIYGQHFDAYGYLHWAAEGIRICLNEQFQSAAQIIMDENGNSFVLWIDGRQGGNNMDLYAQKISVTGELLWNTTGLPITTADCYQLGKMISDGNEGIIIAWENNFCNIFDIYAHRIDKNGNKKWNSFGVPICTEENDQFSLEMISDGKGGAIIIWRDDRNGGYFNIYAQRIDYDGNVKWIPNGIPVCVGNYKQLTSGIVEDQKGGAIILYEDYQNGDADLHVQRIDSIGNVKWSSSGIVIASGSKEQRGIIISDNNGGAIITWWVYDEVDDLYAQRIDSNGTKLWGADGIIVCGFAWAQQLAQMVSDDDGGAIIAWVDSRNGISDIYAQRISNDGLIKWNPDGVPICTAEESQDRISIEKDGSGGAIIVWEDNRGLFRKIYIAQIDASGNLGGGPSVINNESNEILEFNLCQNYPNPFNPSTVISYRLPVIGFVTLKVYDILGREVATLVNEEKPAGEYEVEFDVVSHSGEVRNLPSGIYFYQFKAGEFSQTKKMILLK